MRRFILKGNLYGHGNAMLLRRYWIFVFIIILLTPVTTPGDELLTNSNWSPVIQKSDGVAMVFVPAGCFEMGSANGQPDEWPIHTRCFEKPFWIDRTEVTNAQYGSSGFYVGDWLPREGVTLMDAAAFCESRDARLPTEAEWEYAARGPENWRYPWGNEFDGALVNFCDANCGILDRKDSTVDDGYSYTAPVGSIPGGASWVGALDMSGNVWEWTSSRYEPYPYNANDGREGPVDHYVWGVLRGGAWDNTRADVRAADRIGYLPQNAVYNVGFRCARDAVPQQ